MKVNNKKHVKKNTYLKYKIIAVVFVSLIVLGVYAVREVSDMVAQRDYTIYRDGWEAGHLQGLEEGADSAYDEFYEKLSPNPNVSYLFKKYFPNQEEARIMRAISLAESKGKQTAVNKANRNGSIDSGFFQVNTIHRKKGESKESFIVRMHNLEENFKEASRVLKMQGFEGWATYNNKAYLTYLK